MNLVLKLFNLTKKPRELKEEKREFKKVFSEFIIYDLTITFSWAFLVAILSIGFDDFSSVFKSKKSFGITTFETFLLVSLIAPVLEEYAYRFSLKVSRTTVAVSLAIQIVIYLHLLGFIEVTLFERVIFMVFISICLYFTLSKKVSALIEKSFNFYFYYNLFAFSLLHALNFSYFQMWHYLFIPILISLQFFFGLYLSYIRIRQGFLYALGFHIIHNTLIFGSGYLLMFLISL